MVALLTLLALLALAIPVCAFAGFAMAFGQGTRLRSLENHLGGLERRLQAFERRGAPAEPERPPPAAPVTTMPEDAADPGPAPQPASAPAAPVPAWRTPSITPAAASATPPLSPEPAVASGHGLEETLGTRWAVWVGGVALALGGVFLVRYSIEQGFFGPGARILAGTLFSLALLAAGEWTRRRELASSIPDLQSAYVPGVLTAAGTSTAFATIYAAYALYGMLPSATAFILLGAVSLLTMLGSALHGPALAALGLLTGFVTPVLIVTPKPNLWALVIYLAFIAAAAYGLARIRLWRWLALCSAAGAIAWAFSLDAVSSPDMLPAMAHILAQLALAGFFLVVEPYRGLSDHEQELDRRASAVFLALAVLGVLAATARYAPFHPAFAATLAAGLLGLGLRYAAVAPNVVSATLVAAGTLALWPLTRPISYTVYPDPIGHPTPEALRTYLAFGVSVSAAIAFASLWRIRSAPLPFRSAMWLAAAAALAPLSALVVSYWRVAHLDTSLSFSVAAGCLALAFTAATAWLQRDPRDDAVRLAIGATASAAIAAVAAGLTFALEKSSLTAALALTALGTSWVAGRVAIPILRTAVGATALVVLGRVMWNATLVAGDAGEGLVLNWYLWAYGVPALAFYLASRVLESARRDNIVRLVESLSILFTALLAFFEIRHGVHGDVFAARSGHLEVGLFATTAMAFSIVMIRADAQWPDPVYGAASLGFGAISLIVSVVGLGLAHNPLFTNEAAPGGALLNSLIPAYLLPAALAGAAALLARHTRPQWYVVSAGGVSLGLHFLYTFLEIRRAFHGPFIGALQGTGQAELWSYSIALLAIGGTFLALGLLLNMRLLRAASGVYIIAAVIKVFVIDLSGLEGIARALSFIALGLALVGIGLAYQRLPTARRLGNPASPS